MEEPLRISAPLHRLSIPLPDTPLGTVNAYAVPCDDGVRLIDCGWNTPVAYDSLTRDLEALGASISDIREILITHIHPDHYGLAERLAAESGAPVAMHRLEAMYVGARYEDVAALVAEMETWLAINGVPAAELEAMAAASLGIMRRVGARKPDILLEGGELLEWGSLSLEVRWVPGHSAGLICLYDVDDQILLSSDHVLQHISPHVGLHAQSLGSPLDDYLDSLRSVRDLPVRQVLPGHGEPFTNLQGRVDEIIAHHERRNERILGVLDRPMTAYDVASRLSWRGSQTGWALLEPFQRRMAVTETIAHLEYLHGHGRIHKHIEGAHATYLQH
jgi:glyoxylase-like metal-dependent hydrolase (beta-lactamase superfamily II)